MQNFIATADVGTFIAPSGGVVSGTGLMIGSRFVVATVSVDADEEFAAQVTGIVNHAKVSAQAWTPGVKIYFDAAQGLMTTTSGGNTLVGTAERAAANPSDAGWVRLGIVA